MNRMQHLSHSPPGFRWVAGLILIHLSVLSIGSAASQPEFWYQDNNMRKAGGYPPDFREMWEQPETWQELRSMLDVYYIRGNTLKNILKDFGNDWVKNHFAAILIEDDIPVAIDNIGLRGGYLPAVKELEKMGVEIQSIALQSVLSKFQAKPMKPKERVAEIRRRIPLAVEQLQIARQAFPEVQLGIIDALPPKELPWRVCYPEFVNATRAAGVAIDFIHVDCPLSKIDVTVEANDLHDLRKVLCHDLDLAYGFICTDNIGGMKSDSDYKKSLQRLAKAIPREAWPDIFIVMSWYNHPQFAVRRDAGAIPMTEAALAFFQALKSAF